MKLILHKTESGLVPDKMSIEDYQSISLGAVVKAQVTLPRNYRMLQKFMVLIKYAWQSAPYEMPLNKYREFVEIRAGYGEVYIYPDGTKSVKAQSISFAKMEQNTFNELYSRCLDVIIKDVGTDKESIEKFLGFL